MSDLKAKPKTNFPYFEIICLMYLLLYLSVENKEWMVLLESDIGISRYHQ